jgi:hypothetical protein
MGKHQLTGDPSKYDAICTQLCRDLKAQAVILMVLEGREGNGMSCAGRGQYATIGVPHVLAAYLRSLADKIEAGQPGGIGIDTPDGASS